MSGMQKNDVLQDSKGHGNEHLSALCRSVCLRKRYRKRIWNSDGCKKDTPLFKMQYLDVDKNNKRYRSRYMSVLWNGVVG